jgi:hypothetical protein
MIPPGRSKALGEKERERELFRRSQREREGGHPVLIVESWLASGLGLKKSRKGGHED